MATSAEYPDLRWMPPRAFGRGRDGKAVRYIVIHYTAGAERNTSAEDGAVYDRDRTDGTSTHYFCMSPETRLLTADMRWVPAAEIGVDDELVGFDEYAVAGAKRQMQPAYVTSATRRIADRVRITLADGRVVTSSADHRWLCWSGGNYKWREAGRFQAGQRLCAPLKPWGLPPSAADAGWLAGIFDGEGCFNRAESNRNLSFAQKEGAVLDRAIEVLDRMGLPHAVQEKRTNGVTVVKLSGLQSLLQFLGQCRPVRFIDRPELWAGKSLAGTRLYSAQADIVSVEHIGPGEVVSIATTTRTFIAEGIASHNCDSDSVVQCVLTSDRGNAARTKGNRLGIQYELCGTVQTRAQWLDPASLATLRNAARQVARDCRKYAIPVRRLSVAETRRAWTEFPAGPRGIVGHVDCTNAYPEDGGDHTDPGPQFPWDVFLDMVRAELDPTTEEDIVDDATIAKIAKAVAEYRVEVDPDRKAGDKNKAALQPWSRVDGFGSMERRQLRIVVNEIAAQLKQLTGRDFVDEQAIVTGVLAGLDPVLIAAAIPADLAGRVVDELTARLAA